MSVGTRNRFCGLAEIVFIVKDNQARLWEDLHTYFTDPLANYAEATTTDRGRGRTEVCHIKLSSEMTVYLSTDWP